MTGVEPVTSSLPRTRSTTELHRQKRAGNGTRTRDPQLGRLMLYQLSYSRPISGPAPRGAGSNTIAHNEKWWGEEDSNLRRLRRQIYSLFPLTTRESPLKPHLRATPELAKGLEPPTC